MTGPVQSVSETSCCIVGGGPAGVMLSLMLARRGVSVTLLEAHADFDRDFRGDTIHPSIMDVLEQLGLADRLLQLPHGKVRAMVLYTREGAFKMADFGRLKVRHPYITMLPQVHFLEFITEEAKKCPSFRLIMQANVDQLIEENGVFKGVRYHDRTNQVHEVRSQLTIGADGRFSRIRKLAGFKPKQTAPPMDVIWFRLPRKANDMQEEWGGGFIDNGHMLVFLNRGDEWQMAYVIPKGSYQELRKTGLPELRRAIVSLAPFIADRIDLLQRWDQFAILSVESSRCRRWYRPGLLLIGDAAHVMSPVGGVGINYAVMDAVAAANVLSEPLLAGRVRVKDLEEVQRQREWPTRFIQGFQGMVQRSIVARALASSKKPFRLPWLMRLMPHIPILRDLPLRLIASGIKLKHVEQMTH